MFLFFPRSKFSYFHKSNQFKKRSALNSSALLRSTTTFLNRQARSNSANWPQFLITAADIDERWHSDGTAHRLNRPCRNNSAWFMLFAERLHGPCANKRQEAMTDGLFHGERQLGCRSYSQEEPYSQVDFCRSLPGFSSPWICWKKKLRGKKKERKPTPHFQVIYQVMCLQV